jgi:hypothetical protein
MIHRTCCETGRSEVASGNVDNGVGTFTSKQVRLVYKESKGGAEREKLPSIPAEGIGNHGNFGFKNIDYTPCFGEQVIMAVMS